MSGLSRPPLTGVAPGLSDLQEKAWVEVVGKMEEVYSDLIRHEVELERKNDELEKAQLFIHSVLSSMSEVLIVCDRMQKVREVNAACLLITGEAEENLVGRPLLDLVHPTDNRALSQLRRIGSQDHGAYQDVRLKTRDGAPSETISFNCSSLIDQVGRVAGTVLIGRPMGELRRAYRQLNETHAELKAAQSQLIQSEKMASLGRLVAGVAHELNNPISFINGNVHVLDGYRQRLARYLEAVHAGESMDDLQSLRDDLRIDALLADLDPLLAGTLEGAGRVSEIVKSLRRLSFSGKQAPEPFDLTETVQTALRWAAKGQTSRVRIETDLPENLVAVGHAGQIHQVIVNLVKNAMDAVRGYPEGIIQVSAQAEGDRVRIAVSDNGLGIQEADLVRIFDPFFTTKPVGEGTGLGLWISYGIIKDHGGEITAANRPDGGALFAFDLPTSH